MRDYLTSKETRVLFVLPDMTDPPTRGYEVRAASLAEELKSRFTVELMTADGQLPGQRAQHRKLVGLRRLALPLLRNWPLQTALFDGPEVAARAVRAAVEWKPDIVIVFTERLPFTTIALAGHFPVVLDVVDSMTLHMTERASRGWLLVRWFWKLEAERFGRLASTFSEIARVVVAASATAKSQYPGVIVIPNAASFGSRPRPEPKYDLAFTGNLWYWPNVEAVRIVCEEIAPLVRRRLPQARIVIAGRNPTATVRTLARKANVTLMANVPDLGQLLASSQIALAPISWTPGANLKILDALAVGTPVLTFRAAAAQLPDPFHGVVTCDSAEEMAQVATELLLEEREPVPAAAASRWSDRANTLATMIDRLISDQTLTGRC